MVYYAGMYGNSVLLQHHGILGMKWGKQNGPPYPLDASDHSASEKKAGWRKSLSKSSNDSNKSSGTKNDDFTKERKKLTSKQKRNIAATVAALAVIGGTSYYLYKTGKLDSLTKAGRKAVENTKILGNALAPKRLLQKETIDDTIRLANPTALHLLLLGSCVSRAWMLLRKMLEYRQRRSSRRFSRMQILKQLNMFVPIESQSRQLIPPSFYSNDSVVMVKVMV